MLSGKLRGLLHNPNKILSDYIKPDMWVLDAGCGMGFMAVAAAKLVSPQGRVILVDIQREMLDGAMERMRKAGLEHQVVTIQCKQTSLCLEEYLGKVDFAYAFMVVHEVADKDRLLSDFYASLKPGGMLLIAEPYIHVPGSNFRDTQRRAKAIGFDAQSPKRKINLCRTAVFKKPCE